VILGGWVGSNIPVIEGDAWERFDRSASDFLVLRPYHLTGPGWDGNRQAFEQRHFAAAVRPDADGDLAIARMAHAARMAILVAVGTVRVILDNEPNLHSRPVDFGYIEALLTYHRALQEQLAGLDVRFVCPPLAVAQNSEAWHNALAPVAERCEEVGVHCYGENGDTSLIGYEVNLARRYGKPLVADEVGDPGSISADAKCHTVAAYLGWLADQPDVTASAIFIMGGTPEWAPRFWLPADQLAPIAAVYHATTPGVEKPPEPAKEESMKLVADSDFTATCGQSFTARMHLENDAGQVQPIEGIGTAFIRAPRDDEGHTLGFMDQISFDAENLDLEKDDVDGHFQFTFQVPEFTISSPTTTELFVSVLAMDRTMQTAPTVTEGTFPLQLLPASAEGEGEGEDVPDDGVPGDPARPPPGAAQEKEIQSVWRHLVAIFNAAAMLAQPYPTLLPHIQATHIAVDEIKRLLGYPGVEGAIDPQKSLWTELAVIHDQAGAMANAERDATPTAAGIQIDVRQIKELAGFPR
jgi:hypothetical protein